MSVKKPGIPRQLRHALETFLVSLLYLFFRILPVETASNLGGWIGRRLGPHLPSSATAQHNLARAFPEKSKAEREEIIYGMWDNLGRVMAEYPHLPRLWPRVETVGKEYLEKARDSGKPSIFFPAHLANWEMCQVFAHKCGLDMYCVYRRPNNPGVDLLLRHARAATGIAGLIPKGPGGAKEMLALLKKNGSLGILMDQKLNEGMAIPFFGHDAMTATAIAVFALKFDCPVHPVRIERLRGCSFKITAYPSLALPRSGNKEQDVRAILTEINRQYESWIRERPEQWLWIHRRWPD